MSNPFENRKYKYGAELFLSMYLNQYQFVLGCDLEYYANSSQLFNKENPCNIYFVLKRPKVTIDPKSFKSQEEKAQFDILVQQRDKHHRISLNFESNDTNSKLKLVTEYPYNIFKILDHEEPIFMARPSNLLDSIDLKGRIDERILDYEILYIGQSYGKNGKRTALDRLASHETVQKIYTHALTYNPDCDISILLTNFEQTSALFALGSDLVSSSEEGEKIEKGLVEHFFSNEGIKITEKQRINFTEAALIRYFEPTYNIEFKDNFPDKKHKSYSECYELNLRALTIEIAAPEMTKYLYTSKSGRKGYHTETFEFSNDFDRISLLEMRSSE